VFVLMDCHMELCENWGGDGNVCLCSLLNMDPTGPELEVEDEYDAD
jgi:hypothetical protein